MSAGKKFRKRPERLLIVLKRLVSRGSIQCFSGFDTKRCRILKKVEIYGSIDSNTGFFLGKLQSFSEYFFLRIYFFPLSSAVAQSVPCQSFPETSYANEIRNTLIIK